MVMDEAKFRNRLPKVCRLTQFSPEPDEDMVQVECPFHIVDMGRYGNGLFTINVIRRHRDQDRQIDAWDDPVEVHKVKGMREALSKVVGLCVKYNPWKRCPECGHDAIVRSGDEYVCTAHGLILGKDGELDENIWAIRQPEKEAKRKGAKTRENKPDELYKVFIMLGIALVIVGLAVRITVLALGIFMISIGLYMMGKSRESCP
jgi:hypothetical protein